MPKEADNYFNWKKGELTELKNDDIICKGCDFKIDGNTRQCFIYLDQKPGKVLNGGECDYYTDETE